MSPLDLILQNGSFTPLFHRLSNARTRFVINYGGTGSSKSFSAAQNEILKACALPGTKTLVIRKVANTLRDSVIPSFRNRIAEFGIGDHFAYNKTDRTLTNNSNGSQVIFRGLDDPDKLKSFEGLQRIMVEEAAELDFEDFTELNRRARGREGIQVTLCFNPIHEQHWLKKHFFDKPQPDATVIHSTYKDNPHLTPQDREQIEQMRFFDHNQYRVYALGEWGLSQNKTPWLFAFNRAMHTKPSIPYLPTYPVYLSFDFNRSPVTCLAVQMSPHRGAKDSFISFIAEFAANSQLSELCAQIRSTFPAAILFVTGDAAGNHGDIGFDTRHATYYQMIRSYLNIHERQLHLNSRNLLHHDSRLLINTLLHHYPNIAISAEACPLLINDCIIAQVDEDNPRPGALKKDRAIFKLDLFDCFRYFFQTWFKDYCDKVYLSKK